MTSGQTFVIAGAGLAGAKAVQTLREEGFDGRIVLLGDESERPYERPPLSKEYLRGESEAKPYVHDEGFYADNAIDLRTGTRAEVVDLDASRVRLNTGDELEFDRLLVATGAEPRRLKLPGATLDGVFYLRNVEDSDRLREAFQTGARVVGIGAGWIGAEAAASARQSGCEVTLLEVANLPLERVLGREVATIYRDLHLANGVQFRGGVGIERIEGSERVERIVLADGRAIDADVVLVGVGVTPRSAIAVDSGISTDNGVVVDQHLRSSAENVFAAGDVANAFHPLYGRHVRVEHWANALNQGPTAARNMLGRDEAYERIPYFFSDQYDVGMEYSGYATSWDEVVFRGDPDSREFVAFWLDSDRVVAGMNVNVWDVNDKVQALIRGGQQVDKRALADVDTPLDQMLPATS